MNSAAPGLDTGDGPIGKAVAALRTSVGRYRALGSAPEARRLLGMAAVSYIGDRFNTIALIALSFELGDSALGVGGMIALFSLPRLVVQAPAGALVDRYPGKRLLLVSQVLMALVAGSFALLAVVPHLWLLYGLTLVMGVIRTVDFPAFEVRLMALTPPPQRGTANAVHMLAMTAGEIVGPLLGGVVLAVSGATPLFLINALTFLLLVRVVATLPDRIAANDAHPEAASAPIDTEPTLGYRALLGRSDVLLYTAMLTASCLLFFGVIPLFITRAQDLNLGDGGIGLFYATMGVGTLFGGLLAGIGTYTTRQALAIASTAGMVGALAMAAFGVAEGLIMALPALLLFGMIGDIQEISALTYFQHTLPAGIYGRFFSLFLMATGMGGLIGALAGPALAQAAGTGPALTMLALPMLVLATIFGVREGDLRLAPPLLTRAPKPEPEVIGHGVFGVPSASDMVPDGAVRGAILQPRLRRMI